MVCCDDAEYQQNPRKSDKMKNGKHVCRAIKEIEVGAGRTDLKLISLGVEKKKRNQISAGKVTYKSSNLQEK